MFWEMVWFAIKEIFKMLMAGLILFLIMGGWKAMKEAFHNDPEKYTPFLLGAMFAAGRRGRYHRRK